MTASLAGALALHVMLASKCYARIEVPHKEQAARRWFVRGRVQGVGFRYFAQRAAVDLGLTGYSRNLDDGRVEVYAAGPPEKLSQFAGMLHQGPQWAEVSGVEEHPAEVQDHGSFRIE